jgi:hypothetical protein
MLDRLIDFSVHRRYMALVLSLGFAVFGVFTFSKLKIEAFPDVTNVQVMVISLYPGQAAEEIEKQVTIPLENVSQILPYESNFWQRVYGDISLGYSYAKISGVGQTSFEFDANYTDARLEATLNASVLATQDSSGTSTNQDDISSTVFFSRPHRNFWGYIGELQRNRSLGVDGRATVGTVIGHRMLETGTTRVLGYAGLVYDQEWAAGTGGSRSSLEGALGGTWRVFQFNYPKVSLDSDLIVYPSITESPRYRISADMALTTKISSRFAIKLSGYLNYDSRPPEASATSTDYGVVTSLAYQFGSIVQ